MFPVRLEGTIKLVRTVFFFYKRMMYYKAVTWAEVNNFTDVIFHAVAILTMLKVYGVSYSVPTVVITCLVFMLTLSIIGRLLVLWGVVNYSNQISNSNNPWEQRLLRMEKMLEEINNKLNK